VLLDDENNMASLTPEQIALAKQEFDMSSFSERSGLLYSSHRNPEFEINVAPDKNIKTDTSMANKDDKLT